MKTFVNVNWKLMMKILKIIKIDCRDRRIIIVIQTANGIYRNKRK